LTFFAVAEGAVPLASFVHKPVAEHGDVDEDKHLSSVRNGVSGHARRPRPTAVDHISRVDAITAMIKSGIEADMLEKTP